MVSAATRKSHVHTAERRPSRNFGRTSLNASGEIRPRGSSEVPSILSRRFQDQDYLDLERGYKWAAHERWIELLNVGQFHQLPSYALHG
jgi:hypothetical protein